MIPNREALNLRPDPPDLRDRMYSPTLSSLRAKVNAFAYDESTWTARVSNQGKRAACTGFALATMVKILVDQRYQGSDKHDPPPKVKYSPLMLYAMARKYDDVPGEDPRIGSTIRGAMKAWHKHGACSEAAWGNTDKPSDPRAWMSDAFQTPLGAYYRVDHTSIPDLHAAIADTGVVLVSANIHSGWSTPEADGSINFNSSVTNEGGHAFLIVGYDEKGFWIQNSWNRTWGRNGFARLSYADWRANGWDAWIGQLGVQISGHAGAIGQGLRMPASVELAGKQAVASGAELLSSNPSVNAQQIKPYIINLGNNGLLSDRGQFSTSEEDLESLFKHYLQAAINQFALGDDDPIDVAIYAHGGLVDERNAENTARTWVPALFANRVFPVFIMWETGLLDTIQNILEDRLKAPVAGGGFWEKLLEGARGWVDDRLEELAASLGGGLLWGEMKDNAKGANKTGGGMWLMLKILNDPQIVPAHIRARLRFHLIGHSAGSIYHAHLLEPLLSADARVDGVYWMAPAITIKDFRKLVLPHFDAVNDAKRVRVFTQFYLTDIAERSDPSAVVYGKSILYLVSNAFEGRRETPLMGMDKFFKLEPDLNARKTTPLDLSVAEIWDWVIAPSSSGTDETNCSQSTTHGGFDNDPATMQAILARIKIRQGTP